MTLALDPQKDILVPVPVLKRFATENSFGEYDKLAADTRHHLNVEEDNKEAKYKFLMEDTEEYKTLERNFKALDNTINGFPDEQQAKLISCFLHPFGGRVTEPAQIIWDVLQSQDADYSLRTVETNVRQYQQKKQQALTALATQCQALQTKISDITTKMQQFAQALAAAGIGPGASVAVQPQATTTQESIVKQYMLDKKLYENQLIDRSEYLASLARTKSFFLEAKTNTVSNVVTTNKAKNILDRFKTTKMLYENGLLAHSEYIAALLEVRNVLKENEAPQQTTQSETPEQAKQKLQAWMESVQYNFEPLGTLAVTLQDGSTRAAQTQTLRESKQQLNEFLSLILGALAAVSAWFLGKWALEKFGGWLKKRPDSISGYARISSSQEQQTAAGGLFNALNTGLGPTGQLIGDDGREGINVSTAVQQIENTLNGASQNVPRVTAEANAVLAPDIATRLGVAAPASGSADLRTPVNTTGAALLTAVSGANLANDIQAVRQQIAKLREASTVAA